MYSRWGRHLTHKGAAQPTFGAQWKRSWPSVFMPRKAPWMDATILGTTIYRLLPLITRTGPRAFLNTEFCLWVTRCSNSLLPPSPHSTLSFFASSIAISSRSLKQTKREFSLVSCFGYLWQSHAYIIPTTLQSEQYEWVSCMTWKGWGERKRVSTFGCTSIAYVLDLRT